jgi:hypothetical protein
MEPIILYLDSGGSSPRRMRLFSILYGFLGLSFLVQATLAHGVLKYVLFVFALAWIVITLIYPRLYKGKVMTFDGSGVAWLHPTPQNPTLAWDQIAYIEASSLTFRIHTKDLKLFTVDLANLTYEQHRTVKPQILDLARSKGVDVRMI